MKKENLTINIKGVIFDVVMVLIAIGIGALLCRKLFGDNVLFTIAYFLFVAFMWLAIFLGRRSIKELRKYEKEEKDHPITEEDRPRIFRLSILSLLPLYVGIMIVSCIPIGNIGTFILVAFPSVFLSFIPMKRVYDLQKYLAKYTARFWLVQLAICLPTSLICQTIIQLLM